MYSMNQIDSYKELKHSLAELAEDEYREFSAKLISTERPILGVRIPLVRKLAGAVPAEKISEFLKIKPVSYEEVLLRGFLICRLPYEEMLTYFDSQVDYTGDWSSCDVFCAGLKKIKRHQDEFLDLKIEGLLRDAREYAVRVGLVLLKCYYVGSKYLARIFDYIDGLAGREEYYIRMALAWLIAECFIKYPDEILAYMQASRLPKWTYNKAISKISTMTVNLRLLMVNASLL